MKKTLLAWLLLLTLCLGLLSAPAAADGAEDVNLLGGDFPVVEATEENVLSSPDGTVLIGKGSYEYVFTYRITDVSVAGTNLSFTVTSPNVWTTGIGIKVAVEPGRRYTLSYQHNGYGVAGLLAYTDTAYAYTIKDEADSGFSFTPREDVRHVIAVFRATAEDVPVQFADIRLAPTGDPPIFVPYQPREPAPAAQGVSPDSWEAHAKAFARLMIDAEDSEGFLFFTDAHFMAKRDDDWKDYAYAIFAYLEQLYYSSPCSFVLHGGDWLGSGELQSDIVYKLGVLSGVFRSRFDRYALLVGNHETGNQGRVSADSEDYALMTHDTLAATLLSHFGKTYYRFDANTFRLYCFDTWVSGAMDDYAMEQIEWFLRCLTEETSEHIAIAMHILHDKKISPMGEQITRCANAYNERKSVTVGGTVYDFSDAVGKVAFVLAGHTHTDAVGVENGIPYLETRSLTAYSDTSFDDLPLPLDLIKVDWHNGTLTAYRAARGAEGSVRVIDIIA